MSKAKNYMYCEVESSILFQTVVWKCLIILGLVNGDVIL